MKTDKEFPNGFDSWTETHHEIVKAIHYNLDQPNYEGKAYEVMADEGTGGLYEFAQELTDKFEKYHHDVTWDGEYFDKLEEFLAIELN